MESPSMSSGPSIRSGKGVLSLEQPVVVLVLHAVLHPQHVATAEHGDPEIRLDTFDVAVGGEGSIRDVHNVAFPHLVLEFRVQDLIEPVECDRLVHHPAPNSTRR